LPSRKAIAETAGISPRQMKTMIRVANVAAADFDAVVESDNPPTPSNRPAQAICRTDLARLA
jgi:hypothetical protein